jgi:hypothetical protein
MNSKSEVAKTIRYNRDITQRTKNDHYRLNRFWAGGYFGIVPKWEKIIANYFKELHEQNEKAIYVDVCGRASASYLGADKNYQFCLQPYDHKIELFRDEITVHGDIFNEKDYYSFLKLLRQNNDFPALITFLPVAGLQGYTPDEIFGDAPNMHSKVTYQRLKNNLRKSIEVLREGGYIFIDRPFQFGRYAGAAEFMQRRPQDQYELSLWMKLFCKEMKCTLKVESNIGGPHFLIRKRRKARRQ